MPPSPSPPISRYSSFTAPPPPSQRPADRPKPPVARRKRIVESVITEPIERPPPPPQVSDVVESSNNSARSSSGNAQAAYSPPTETVKTSTRNRPRRSPGSSSAIAHSSDYSLEVQPITALAIDRKDKYTVNQRVLEIAAKVTVQGELQKIKCFGCTEDDLKRIRALEEYEELHARGEADTLSPEDLEKLNTPVICMYYDPAERGLIKGVRMSDLNYGRCANCMTHGRGCWWPTESLAPGSTATPALAGTSTGVGTLAHPVELGHVVDEETNAKRSKRIESRRAQEPRKTPRKVPAKRKSTASGSAPVESQPTVPPVAEPSQAISVSIEPNPEPLPKTKPSESTLADVVPADKPQTQESDVASAETNAALRAALIFMQNEDFDDDSMDGLQGDGVADVGPAADPPEHATVEQLADPGFDGAEQFPAPTETAVAETVPEGPVAQSTMEVEPAVEESASSPQETGESSAPIEPLTETVNEAKDPLDRSTKGGDPVQAEPLEGDVPAGADGAQFQVPADHDVDNRQDRAGTQNPTTVEDQYSFLFQSQEEEVIDQGDEMVVDQPVDGNLAEEIAMNDVQEREPSAEVQAGPEAGSEAGPEPEPQAEAEPQAEVQTEAQAEPEAEPEAGPLAEPDALPEAEPNGVELLAAAEQQPEADEPTVIDRDPDASDGPLGTSTDPEPAAADDQTPVEQEPDDMQSSQPPAQDFVPETQRDPASAEPNQLDISVEAEPAAVEDQVEVSVSYAIRDKDEAPDDDEAEIEVVGSRAPAAVAVASTLKRRTRNGRSTRAANLMHRSSSTTNKHKKTPNAGNPTTSGITPTTPATYQLTQKWLDRLAAFPIPDIVIDPTSVPLRYDNTNLMSLDIPGVNKVFRKCMGCTLRECECAPLPVEKDEQDMQRANYWQNSVLDSAGCLTCRICGVICSFQLDPPIYGEFDTLPSPRTLDDMKLLPEDWDTRSTLDGFEGQDDQDAAFDVDVADRNGTTESRPQPSHSDPTFLQSNKCSGCILRQCRCVALPAGEGRGGGCVKCQECNVACSFGVATPKADGKTVVWADADSTKIGGRAGNGSETKRGTQSKRRVLAAASDDEGMAGQGNQMAQGVEVDG